ncbi:hypothetical protein P4H94_28735, partial [Paenibacillus macerans]|uniref:hypothetical protein n=1 Tax=Paenibacillus macerans TaxID=44252 RepID=UPI002DBD22DA
KAPRQRKTPAESGRSQGIFYSKVPAGSLYHSTPIPFAPHRRGAFGTIQLAAQSGKTEFNVQHGEPSVLLKMVPVYHNSYSFTIVAKSMVR